jgi:outer membrane protein OmpA-like peptidoglycan-associated protein
VDSVLGGKSNSVTEWLSSFANINKTASTSLLSLALPLVLGAVSKKISSAGASAGNLAGFLQGQMSLQPAPVGLAGVLGLDDLPHPPVVGTYESPPRQETASRPPVVGTYAAEAREGGSTWWKWALPVLALGLLGYFLSTRREPTTPVSSIATSGVVSSSSVASSPVTPPVTAPTNTLGPFVERKLVNDVVLNVPENGVESKLIAFIKDPNRKVDKDTWFTFDRLEFDTDSATLKPSSEEQLRNVAEILKAYPNVKVKIGGYTDNVGDDAHNLKLSQDRAANTMNEIANLGIDRSRLAAEGFGKQYPVADNTTEEGRQRNRRIDIRVTNK